MARSAKSSSIRVICTWWVPQDTNSLPQPFGSQVARTVQGDPSSGGELTTKIRTYFRGGVVEVLTGGYGLWLRAFGRF